MSTDVVRNALAAMLADLPLGTPTIFADPSGYGWDTRVLQDSDADQRMVGGVEGVALDVARRYLTQRGTLKTDLDYGLPIVDFLHGAIPGTPEMWSVMVELEAVKDPRVTSAACVWTVTAPNAHDIALTLYIPSEAGVQAVRLVFTLSSTTLAVVIAQ